MPFLPLLAADTLTQTAMQEERRQEASARVRAAFSGGLAGDADVLSLAAQLVGGGGEQLADELVADPVDPMGKLRHPLARGCCAPCTHPACFWHVRQVANWPTQWTPQAGKFPSCPSLVGALSSASETVCTLGSSPQCPAPLQSLFSHVCSHLSMVHLHASRATANPLHSLQCKPNARISVPAHPIAVFMAEITQLLGSVEQQQAQLEAYLHQLRQQQPAQPADGAEDGAQELSEAQRRQQQQLLEVEGLLEQRRAAASLVQTSLDIAQAVMQQLQLGL